MRTSMLVVSLLFAFAAAYANNEIVYNDQGGFTTITTEGQVYYQVDDARMMTVYFNEAGDWVFVRIGAPRWISGELMYSGALPEDERAISRYFFQTLYRDGEETIPGSKLLTQSAVQVWPQANPLPAMVQKRFSEIGRDELEIPEAIAKLPYDDDGMINFYELVNPEADAETDTIPVFQENIVVALTDDGKTVQSGYDAMANTTYVTHDDGQVSRSDTKERSNVRLINTAIVVQTSTATD